MPALTTIGSGHLLVDWLRLSKSACVRHSCLDVSCSEVLLLGLFISYPWRNLRIIDRLHVPLGSVISSSVLCQFLHFIRHAQSVLCDSFPISLSAYSAGSWSLAIRRRRLRLLLLLDAAAVPLCFGFNFDSVGVLLGVGLRRLQVGLILAGSKTDVILAWRERRVGSTWLSIWNARL